MTQTASMIIMIAVMIFAAGQAAAQSFVDEDFSTATGTTPPMGWATATTGTFPALWRFDNPGSRSFDSGFTAPFAICDSNDRGALTSGSSVLTSPAFNAGGITLMNLSFATQFRAQQTAGDFARVEVFDGAMWNSVASYTTDVGYLAATNPSGTAEIALDITAAAGYATNAQLRFNHGYGYDWWWAIDDVKVFQPMPVDLAMTSIDNPMDDPEACLPLAGSVDVAVTIENQGVLPVIAGTLIQFQFDVGGGAPTIEFLQLNSDLDPNNSLQYSFIAQAALPAPGPSTLNLGVSLLGDGDPTNDGLSQSYVGASAPSAVSSFPYLETFDSITIQDTTIPPPLWRQDTRDGLGTGSDWFFRSGPTPTVITGPNGDHSSGNGRYAYVRDTFNLAQVNLLSPCFDTTMLAQPELRFWLHSLNANVPSGTFENFFSIDVVTFPNGLVTLDALGPLGSQGSGWKVFTLDLTPFAGQTLQLVFRGQSNSGSSLHDIAIDDVAFYDRLPTPGQVPRPGLAVLDINDPVNPNGLPISLAAGGPYFAEVAIGDIMAIQIEGEANAPIAFLAGPLGPVSASYLNVGQLDIGGAVSPLTGVPVGIVVVADGFNPTSLINAIFNTGPFGSLDLGFQTPPLPSGPLGTFQALLATSNGNFFAISNAVELSIN